MPTTDTMDIILDTLTTDTTDTDTTSDMPTMDTMDTHTDMPVMDTTMESNPLMDIIINLNFSRIEDLPLVKLVKYLVTQTFKLFINKDYLN